MALDPFRRATDGAHGSGSKRHGARGKDLVVPVPVLAAADLIAVTVLGPLLPQLGPVISETHLAWLRPIFIVGLFFTIAAWAWTGIWT